MLSAELFAAYFPQQCFFKIYTPEVIQNLIDYWFLNDVATWEDKPVNPDFLDSCMEGHAEYSNSLFKFLLAELHLGKFVSIYLFFLAK